MQDRIGGQEIVVDLEGQRIVSLSPTGELSVRSSPDDASFSHMGLVSDDAFRRAAQDGMRLDDLPALADELRLRSDLDSAAAGHRVPESRDSNPPPSGD